MRCRWRSPQRGFTLVELLVVIAVIGILVALLLPAVQHAREAMRRASCQSNLKQIGLALQTYHDRTRSFPFGWDTHGTGWSAMILPELEQQPLYDTLRFAETSNWATGPNETAAGTLIPVFRCPSLNQPEHVDDSDVKGRVPASYRGCGSSEVMTDDAGTAPAGYRSFQEIEHNGIFYGCSHIGLRALVDGTSTTILIGESSTDVDFMQNGNAMDYWSLGSPQVDPCNCDGSAAGTEFTEFVGSTAARLNARWNAATSGYEKEMSFGSYHVGGAYFGFADGSVRFVTEGVDHALYRALGSRNGGEPIGKL